MSDSEEVNSSVHPTHEYGTQTSIAVNTNENASEGVDDDEVATTTTDAVRDDGIAEEEGEVVITKEQGGAEEGEDQDRMDADAAVEDGAAAAQDAGAVADAESAAVASEEKAGTEAAIDSREDGGRKTDEDAPVVGDSEAGEKRDSAGQEAEDGKDEVADGKSPGEVEGMVGEKMEGEAEQQQEEEAEVPVKVEDEEKQKEEAGEKQDTGEQPQDVAEKGHAEDKPEQEADQPVEPTDDTPQQAEKQPPEGLFGEKLEEQPPIEAQGAVGEVHMDQSSREVEETERDAEKQSLKELKGEEDIEPELGELDIQLPEQTDYYKDATATEEEVITTEQENTEEAQDQMDAEAAVEDGAAAEQDAGAAADGESVMVTSEEKVAAEGDGESAPVTSEEKVAAVAAVADGESAPVTSEEKVAAEADEESPVVTSEEKVAAEADGESPVVTSEEKVAADADGESPVVTSEEKVAAEADGESPVVTSEEKVAAEVDGESAPVMSEEKVATEVDGESPIVTSEEKVATEADGESPVVTSEEKVTAEADGESPVVTSEEKVAAEADRESPVVTSEEKVAAEADGESPVVTSEEKVAADADGESGPVMSEEKVAVEADGESPIVTSEEKVAAEAGGESSIVMSEEKVAAEADGESPIVTNEEKVAAEGDGESPVVTREEKVAAEADGESPIVTSEEKVAAEAAVDSQEDSGKKTDSDALVVADSEAGEKRDLTGQEAEDEQPSVQVEEMVGEKMEEEAEEQKQEETEEALKGEDGEQPKEDDDQSKLETDDQPMVETGEQQKDATEEQPRDMAGKEHMEDKAGDEPEEPVDNTSLKTEEHPPGEQEGEEPKEQPPTDALEVGEGFDVEQSSLESESEEVSREADKQSLEEPKGEEGVEPEPGELAIQLHEQTDEFKNATATVKFVLMPSGQVATQRCRLNETLGELKEQFSQELKIPVSMILLLYNGKNIANDVTLAGLGVGPTAMVQLEMQSADPVNNPIKQFPPRQEYHMPDVITVRVQAEDGVNYKDVVVEIERCTKRKPFIGGFKHRVTGSEFHNASAQTLPKPKPATGKVLYSRDSQTVEERHLTQQTTNDMSTQMTKIGVYVTNGTDVLLAPQAYTTAEEREKFILEQVIMLQKYYRRWLARKYVQKVREDTEHRLEWERQEELRKKNEKEERIRREFERRMNPKTREDFDLLYHALEKWRQEEVENINKTLEGAERKAALCQLLEQETELIASIGRHKIDSDAENRVLRIQNFLSKAAAPKRWKGFDGRHMEMMTPYSIRAEELKEIYNSINMKYLTQDERLDVLLTLKHTVKEHDCKLTQDIIELIDREADLLMRGVRESNLDGLRRRISTLFLQYLKTPTFNPRIAKLLKVPQDPSVLRQNIYFCPSCEQYLRSTEFQLSSNSRVVGNCRRCNKIDNDARVRQDYSHYRFMLRQLRREEEAYGDASKIAFLMQEKDMRYLVENVWNSQSILSAWEDLYDLVLVRWDHFTEWSPWNCILLTKEEASAHIQLKCLTEAYGSTFMHKVEHKHTLARSYFSRLPGTAELLRRACDKKAEANVQGTGLVTKPGPRPGKSTTAY